MKTVLLTSLRSVYLIPHFIRLCQIIHLCMHCLIPFIKIWNKTYGFHGTSHSYVSKRACEILNLDYKTPKIITCHLGNGASITAIKDGKSLDTSMGLTPVEGLIMGTRSGDVDAGALTLIMEKEEIDFSSLNTLLNKHSGILGISGISSDMREVESALKKVTSVLYWLLKCTNTCQKIHRSICRSHGRSGSPHFYGRYR